MVLFRPSRNIRKHQRCGNHVRLCADISGGLHLSLNAASFAIPDMACSYVVRPGANRILSNRMRSNAGQDLTHDKRVAGYRAAVDPDAFGLQIFAYSADPVFPPQAGILVAAKRRHEADRAIGIDPDRACFEIF